MILFTVIYIYIYTCDRTDLQPLKPLQMINLSAEVGEEVKGLIIDTYKEIKQPSKVKVSS